MGGDRKKPTPMQSAVIFHEHSLVKKFPQNFQALDGNSMT